MNIPESFHCAGFNIKVEIVDKLPSNNYGEYCDATNTISIGKKVDVEGWIYHLYEIIFLPGANKKLLVVNLS